MNEPISQRQSPDEGAADADARWPRTYRIVVEGRLDANWSERLAGMRIAPAEDAGPGAGTTVLEGLLRDQSELSGVVNTLCDLQLPLLEVEILGPEGAGGGRSTT